MSYSYECKYCHNVVTLEEQVNYETAISCDGCGRGAPAMYWTPVRSRRRSKLAKKAIVESSHSHEVSLSVEKEADLRSTIVELTDINKELRDKYKYVLQDNIKKEKEIDYLKANSMPMMPEGDPEFSEKMDKVLASKRKPNNPRRILKKRKH